MKVIYCMETYRKIQTPKQKKNLFTINYLKGVIAIKNLKANSIFRAYLVDILKALIQV